MADRLIHVTKCPNAVFIYILVTKMAETVKLKRGLQSCFQGRKIQLPLK